MLDLRMCMCFVFPPQVHCMLNLHDIHMSYLPLAHMFERVVEVRIDLGLPCNISYQLDSILLIILCPICSV